MRIGNGLAIRCAGAVIALIVATSATRSEAGDQVQPVPLGGSLPDQKGR